MSDYKYTVYLDAGHGGINPSNNQYTTYRAKQFYHGKGEFHKGKWFYEGVSNRKYVDMICDKLHELGIRYEKVYHPWLDTSLFNRVSHANHYHKNGMPGVYYSFHSNATHGHDARGFSIWTSPGYTKSDGLAEDFFMRYRKGFTNHELYNIKTLQDLKDKDHDYEAQFYVLKNTMMPAVLFENLFFDNYEDAVIINDPFYIDEYTDLFVEHVLWMQQQQL